MSKEDTHPTPSPYGLWLRRARQAAGLSQAVLAERAGVHRINIAYIETGRTQLPREATHDRLVAALGQPAPPDIQELFAEGVRGRVVACSFCRERASGANELVVAAHRRACICLNCLRLVNATVATRLRDRRAANATRHASESPPQPPPR